MRLREKSQVNKSIKVTRNSSANFPADSNPYPFIKLIGSCQAGTLSQVRPASHDQYRGNAMKAIVQNDYGSPDVLELKDIDMPVVKDDGMLVIVHATAVNAGDVFSMRCLLYER